MISELRMAQIVAVTRLAMPRAVVGNCTHEPCTQGAGAGANLFWAEVGGNPRDIKEKTRRGPRETVASCRQIFREGNWELRRGPSMFYSRESRKKLHDIGVVPKGLMIIPSISLMNFWGTNF